MFWEITLLKARMVQLLQLVKLVTSIIPWENECIDIPHKYYLAKHKSAKSKSKNIAL